MISLHSAIATKTRKIVILLYIPGIAQDCTHCSIHVLNAKGDHSALTLSLLTPIIISRKKLCCNKRLHFEGVFSSSLNWMKDQN